MRTVGELRAALEGVPDDAEWLVCVDVERPTAPVSDERVDAVLAVLEDIDTGKGFDAQEVAERVAEAARDDVFIDPGVTRAVKVVRPGEKGWPFSLPDDPSPPPAMAYLMVGEWTS